ncbi:MAG: branched-chain amino acid ABC transporter permease [Candidatus Marsarchaeota archaeon]|nr:branched-chain amino acid ABC transporter permease [Candidatus Marsarchaeota archaeon]
MQIVQLIANGFCVGALYALLGIGFSLTYSTNRVFDVAYGAIIIASQYVFYLWFTNVTGDFFSAFAVTLVAGAVLGLLLHTLVYRQLQKRGVSLVGLMIISLGVFYLVQNLLAIFFSARTLTLTKFTPTALDLGQIRLPLLYVQAVVVAAVVVLLLTFFLHRTELGILLRALADNPNMVLITGSSPTMLFIVAAAIGSAIGALSGGFMVMDVGVRPDIGFTILLKAAIAAIVGGVGSISGALMAGIILGIIENLVIWKLPAEWQGVLVFFVLLVLLLWFREGIFTKGFKRREV